MISLEQTFKETEKAAESTLNAAKDLSARARALQRAAKNGNISAIKREQDNLNQALIALQQEVHNAASSWPFQDEELEQHLNDGYKDELQNVAADLGLNVYERDGNLISYPSIVRVLPREKAVRVDRKKSAAIRPSHLADLLLKMQTKTSGFSSARFLESLYTVYSEILSGKNPGRLALGGGVVVPLIKIYTLMTALPGAGREYDRSDFARDLYILDSEGPRQTKAGATFSLPSSTAARYRKTDLFSFIGPEGQPVTYYGIKFSEDT